jgi:DNA-binding CsgD family transcriptional regulator
MRSDTLSRQGYGTSTQASASHQDLDPRLGSLLAISRRRNAKMIRMNRDIVMFSFLVLVVAALTSAETERTELVAAIAIPSLVGIWLFSRVQGRSIDRTAENEVVAICSVIPSGEPDNGGSAPAHPAAVPCPLSDRELQVLATIAHGNSNKAVGVAMGITEQTVKNHLKHIFGKLQVYDRRRAIMAATNAGWMTGTPSGTAARVEPFRSDRALLPGSEMPGYSVRDGGPQTSGNPH